ncbi:MAG: acetylneuraminic acid synthetase, partial [Cutibacterium avidum]|nr:acetylneuraminic acid synthetase [Cutibacterium avidum]
MIVNRQTTPFAVFGEDTILTALTKITDNKSGIVFCVDEHGILTGSFSDGDFRRWITSEPDGDMTTPVQAAANRECIHTPLD